MKKTKKMKKNKKINIKISLLNIILKFFNYYFKLF